MAFKVGDTVRRIGTNGAYGLNDKEIDVITEVKIGYFGGYGTPFRNGYKTVKNNEINDEKYLELVKEMTTQLVKIITPAPIKQVVAGTHYFNTGKLANIGSYLYATDIKLSASAIDELIAVLQEIKSAL